MRQVDLLEAILDCLKTLESEAVNHTDLLSRIHDELKAIKKKVK